MYIEYRLQSQVPMDLHLSPWVPLHLLLATEKPTVLIFYSLITLLLVVTALGSTAFHAVARVMESGKTKTVIWADKGETKYNSDCVEILRRREPLRKEREGNRQALEVSSQGLRGERRLDRIPEEGERVTAGTSEWTRKNAEKREQEREEEIRKAQERLQEVEEARALFEAEWMNGMHPGITLLTPERVIRARSSYLDGRTHIAFVGTSGVGKSTLVNSIRGLRANELGAAPVKQTEGAREIDPYPDPLRPQHVWYDVPGAGASEDPGWKYFMEQELYVFDALVVVFSDRFLQNETRVLSNAAKLGIPTFLVRSKSDQIVHNVRMDFDLDAVEGRDRYVRETQEYVREILSNIEGVDEDMRVYMVSRDSMRRAGLGLSTLTQNEMDDDSTELVQDLTR